MPLLTVSFFVGRVPTKMDYRKNVGTLILTSLLEDTVYVQVREPRKESLVCSSPGRVSW